MIEKDYEYEKLIRKLKKDHDKWWDKNNTIIQSLCNDVKKLLCNMEKEFKRLEKVEDNGRHFTLAFKLAKLYEFKRLLEAWLL